MKKFKYQTWLHALSLVMGTVAASYASFAFSKSMDVSLTQAGIEPNLVSSAFAVSFGSESENGTFKAGSFEIKPVMPASFGVSRPIRFSFDSKKEEGKRLEIFTCRLSECEELSRGGAKTSFAIDNSVFALELLDTSPCVDATKACEIIIPSSSLEQMRASAKSGIRDSGSQLVAVELKDHSIALVRPLFSDIWMQFERKNATDLGDLGDLKGAQVLGGQILLLRFNSGFIMWHRDKDALLLGSTTSLQLGRGGLASLKSGLGFDSILSLDDGGKALAFMDNAIAYKSGLAKVDWDHPAGKDTVIWKSFDSELKLDSAAVAENGAAQHFIGLSNVSKKYFDLDSDGRAKNIVVIPESIDLSRVELIGNGAAMFHRDGMNMIGAGGLLPSSIARPIRSGRNLGFGHVLLKESRPGCVLTHFRARSGEIGSFAESGYEFPCDRSSWFSVSSSAKGPAVLSSTSLSGASLKVDIQEQ